MRYIKLFESFGLLPDPDDEFGQENYKKYKSGEVYKMRPEDREVVGHDVKGRPVMKYKYRDYDESMRDSQVDRTSFTLHSNQVKYNVGDVIRLNDRGEIREVTIIDIIETPYQNIAGGNAFVPHTFRYKFK
jgi:hypothetical protein